MSNQGKRVLKDDHRIKSIPNQFQRSWCHFLEENVLLHALKICHIYYLQSIENRPFLFFWEARYRGWKRSYKVYESLEQNLYTAMQ